MCYVFMMRYALATSTSLRLLVVASKLASGSEEWGGTVPGTVQ